MSLALADALWLYLVVLQPFYMMHLLLVISKHVTLTLCPLRKFVSYYVQKLNKDVSLIHKEQSFVTVPTTEECVVSTTLLSSQSLQNLWKGFWRYVRKPVSKGSLNSDTYRMFSFITWLNIFLVAQRGKAWSGQTSTGVLSQHFMKTVIVSEVLHIILREGSCSSHCQYCSTLAFVLFSYIWSYYKSTEYWKKLKRKHRTEGDAVCESLKVSTVKWKNALTP